MPNMHHRLPRYCVPCIAPIVIAAAIMHGTLNGAVLAPSLVLRGGDSMAVGVVGLAGILALVALNLTLYGNETLSRIATVMPTAGTD
jgi:hypothetical protein